MADNDDSLSVGGISRAGGTAAPAGADAVEGAGATAGVLGLEGAGPGTIDAIARALADGAIDAAGATTDLVAQSVAAALGPGADPAAVAALREEVMALLAGDPTLAALLGRT